MPLATDIKPNETLTVNGIRLAFSRAVRVTILDPASIVYPNGRRNEPLQNVKENESGAV